MLRKVSILLIALFLSMAGNASLIYAEDQTENEEEPIIDEYVGQPHYDYDEGSYNGVYYNVSMMASGARCWVFLHYGINATLRTEMTVYVGLFLGSWYTTIPVINSGYTTDIASDWNDGGTYIAAGAYAVAKISGTQVYSMSLSTYSS